MLTGHNLLQRALYHERQSGHAAPQQQGQAYSHMPARVQEQHSRQQVAALHAPLFNTHANAASKVCAMVCAVTHLRTVLTTALLLFRRHSSIALQAQ